MNKKGRKRNINKNYWNERQIEEVENKLNRKEIEILKDERKLEMKTKNKLLMENAAQHIEAINGHIEDLRNTNKPRKFKE